LSPDPGLGVGSVLLSHGARQSLLQSPVRRALHKKSQENELA